MASRTFSPSTIQLSMTNQFVFMAVVDGEIKVFNPGHPESKQQTRDDRQRPESMIVGARSGGGSDSELGHVRTIQTERLQRKN